MIRIKFNLVGPFFFTKTERSKHTSSKRKNRIKTRIIDLTPPKFNTFKQVVYNICITFERVKYYFKSVISFSFFSTYRHSSNFPKLYPNQGHMQLQSKVCSSYGIPLLEILNYFQKIQQGDTTRRAKKYRFRQYYFPSN